MLILKEIRNYGTRSTVEPAPRSRVLTQKLLKTGVFRGFRFWSSAVQQLGLKVSFKFNSTYGFAASAAAVI